MWLIITPTEKHIYLKPNTPVSIGRIKSDILLSHDTSISRSHASIVVKLHSTFKIGKPASSCILTDKDSKYGTYICKNGTFERVTTDVYLNDQDVIRIGLQKEILTVKYISIISMTSALQDNEKEKLLEIMNIIDGISVTYWTKHCTHLTVTKPKLTQKVATSLAACIPIVTIDYWDAVKASIETGGPLPETDKFTPKINEQYISKIPVSLSPNYERKTLFTNLTFVFFCTEQYRLYKAMIKCAGGIPVLFNPYNENNNICEHNYIFIRYSETANTQPTEDFIREYGHICKKLNTLKCRVIPESEISLAILHCSTKQYCNPKYNFVNCLKIRETANYSLPETLVLDTQDQDILMVQNVAKKQKSYYNKHTNYVAETLEIDNNTSMKDDAMSQENVHNLKELTLEKERTTSKKLFVPETIESPSSSQRNINSCIKQNSNYNFIKENIDSNPKEMHNSISVTFAKKRVATCLDECDNEQVVTSHRKASRSELQICIPETINENDSNEVTIRNEIRKDKEDMLITTKNVLKAKATENIQSCKVQNNAEKNKTQISSFSSNIKFFKEINNSRKIIPGKTFKKGYIKVPEKRMRLMNTTEKN